MPGALDMGQLLPNFFIENVPVTVKIKKMMASCLDFIMKLLAWFTRVKNVPSTKEVPKSEFDFAH